LQLRQQVADALDHGQDPFYTGKQKTLDTAGRIEKFNQKYGKKTPASPKAPAA